MRLKQWLALIVSLALCVVAAACGGRKETPALPPTVDAVAVSVRQTVEAIAVAQTVVALTAGTSTSESDLPPSLTPEVASVATSAPPTAEPTAVSANPTVAQPTPETAVSCTALIGVNLRSGPGLAYDPPVGSIGPNTVARPLAYVPVGRPQGAWLQVEVEGTGQVAWVSAGPQFVSCTVDPASLPPPSTIPPVPPTATPTLAPPVAALPPDLRNISGGAGCLDDPDIDSDFQTDSRFLLRIFAQLFNPPPGESGDGAGIDRVEFFVRESGYSHTERTAGYCIFQGGEPSCRDWPRNALGQLTWGNGGAVVVDGDYNIDVSVFPKEETFISQCNWTISLTIDVP